MDKPCHLGTVHEATNFGTASKVDDVDVYISEPKGTANGAAVIVIHDIYGFFLPNTRNIADLLAEKGYYAIMPDFYHGDAWPLNGDWSKFMAWFSTIDMGRAEKDFKTILTFLKAKNFSKIGSVGFCWGGGVVAKIVAPQGLVDCGVSCHGVKLSVDDFHNAKMPLFLAVADKDPDHAPESVIKAVEELVAKHPEKNVAIKFYPGTTHGFVNRGSFDDEYVKGKSMEARADLVAFLQKYL
eukprot:Colp12_sorted_trinity150504_noHs@36195